MATYDSLINVDEWISDHYFTTDETKGESFTKRVKNRTKEWTQLEQESGAPSPIKRFQAERGELQKAFATEADTDELVTDDDGSSRFAIHDAESGAHLRDVVTPGVGVGDFLTLPRWSADSQGLALTWTSPTVAADVVLVDAATGRTGTVASWSEDLDGAEVTIAPEW